MTVWEYFGHQVTLAPHLYDEMVTRHGVDSVRNIKRLDVQPNKTPIVSGVSVRDQANQAVEPSSR